MCTVHCSGWRAKTWGTSGDGDANGKSDGSHQVEIENHNLSSLETTMKAFSLIFKDVNDDDGVFRGDPRGSLRKTSGPPSRPPLSLSAVETSR